jgi:hypothetical protein
MKRLSFPATYSIPSIRCYRRTCTLPLNLEQVLDPFPFHSSLLVTNKPIVYHDLTRSSPHRRPPLAADAHPLTEGVVNNSFAPRKLISLARNDVRSILSSPKTWTVQAAITPPKIVIILCHKGSGPTRRPLIRARHPRKPPRTLTTSTACRSQ